MALNYSKDRPLAPGVELPTTLSMGMRFLSSLGRPASLLRNCGTRKSSFTANCPTSSQDD